MTEVCDMLGEVHDGPFLSGNHVGDRISRINTGAPTVHREVELERP